MRVEAALAAAHGLHAYTALARAELFAVIAKLGGNSCGQALGPASHLGVINRPEQHLPSKGLTPTGGVGGGGGEYGGRT